jgi:hypothetical protein
MALGVESPVNSLLPAFSGLAVSTLRVYSPDPERHRAKLSTRDPSYPLILSTSISERINDAAKAVRRRRRSAKTGQMIPMHPDLLLSRTP